MENPLISVIVTTFNRKELLGETIKSILNQSFVNIEIIIVDNYSDYEFIDFIHSFNDKRIKAYQNQNNGIIAVNRNFGIKYAAGKYLAFCDDDDTWMPEKLKEQIASINQHKDTEKLLIYTNCECFGPDIKTYITKKKKKSTINDFVFENYITLSSVLVFKSDFIYFDETPELKTVEDFFLWMNLIINDYKMVLIEKALVKYYVNYNSESRKYQKYSHLKFLQCLLLIQLRYPDNKIKKMDFLWSAITHLFKYSIKNILISGSIK